MYITFEHYFEQEHNYFMGQLQIRLDMFHHRNMQAASCLRFGSFCFQATGLAKYGHDY